LSSNFRASEPNLDTAASGLSEAVAPGEQAPLSSYGVGEDSVASEAQPALSNYGTK